MHCLPFTAKRSLIGARQTEDRWKPPDRESVGAKAQDKVSMRPEGLASKVTGHKYHTMHPTEGTHCCPAPV